MKNLIGFSKVLPRGTALGATLVLMIIAAMTASGCFNDPANTSTHLPPDTQEIAGDKPDITSTQSIPTTQQSVRNGIASKPMLQLPNIADTVEQVRPAVVSIVAKTISLDRFGRQTQGFGTGTGVIFDESGPVSYTHLTLPTKA